MIPDVSKWDLGNPASWPLEVRPAEFLTLAQLIDLLEKQAAAPAIPLCPTCGKELKIVQAGPDGITYACEGRIGDSSSLKFAPGRTFMDEHYRRSVTHTDNLGDPRLRRLLQEFAALQERLVARDAQIARLQQFIRKTEQGREIILVGSRSAIEQTNVERRYGLESGDLGVADTVNNLSQAT